MPGESVKGHIERVALGAGERTEDLDGPVVRFAAAGSGGAAVTVAAAVPVVAALQAAGGE